MLDVNLFNCIPFTIFTTAIIFCRSLDLGVTGELCYRRRDALPADRGVRAGRGVGRRVRLDQRRTERQERAKLAGIVFIILFVVLMARGIG
jgi:hypothetical protein